MNESVPLMGHRVAIATKRPHEGIAALLRHELEHALQLMAHGLPLGNLHGLTFDVLCDAVGGQPGGGALYNEIPMEADANAAASVFVRARYGDDRIDELMAAEDPDCASFRSLTGPHEMETLPNRMLQFLADHAAFCEAYAGDATFNKLLNDEMAGSGAIWREMVDKRGPPSEVSRPVGLSHLPPTLG